MRFQGPVATFTVVCLTSGLALGSWNGSAAGASSRHACPAELLTGETVVVSGFVANRAGTGAGSRRVLRLTDANILKGGQVCPVVGLMVRVSSRTASPGPGAHVRVRGEWMKLAESGRWPTRPERQGLVTGIITESVSSGGVSWAVRSRFGPGDPSCRTLAA